MERFHQLRGIHLHATALAHCEHSSMASLFSHATVTAINFRAFPSAPKTSRPLPPSPPPSTAVPTPPGDTEQAVHWLLLFLSKEVEVRLLEIYTYITAEWPVVKRGSSSSPRKQGWVNELVGVGCPRARLTRCPIYNGPVPFPKVIMVSPLTPCI